MGGLVEAAGDEGRWEVGAGGDVGGLVEAAGDEGRWEVGAGGDLGGLVEQTVQAGSVMGGVLTAPLRQTRDVDGAPSKAAQLGNRLGVMVVPSLRPPQVVGNNVQ